MIEYTPTLRVMPSRTVDVPTAWREVAPIVADLLARFNVGLKSMLEFGVDYGYSTAVFANYFDHVIGVDHFMGDINAGDRGDGIYPQVLETLKPFKNITLVPLDYRKFIKGNDTQFDCIHVDIVHNYEQTYECGAWSVEHAPVVFFHDTLAFPDVMRACTDLALNYDLEFYNVPEQHGLGVLVRR